MVLASALATLAAYGIVLATRDLGDFPRAVFVVYGLAAAALAAASRWCVRFVPEAGGGPDDGRRRVLVVGAGQSGRGVARDLRAAADVRVVGFLDDNPRLRRRRVQGVPVLGSIGDAAAVLESTHSDELVVTIPDAERARLEAVAAACEAAGVAHRVVRERPEPARAATQALAE
jgi:FlaA1/EpsC-like NDP-sugar epimerase